ncbi:hypothetical protein SEA_MUSETTA_23 [Microbacterium phage Musetta]|nr:hypothetical protein SEA_MUSETTA_23 [Microbacterium phage Musetta]QYC54146.1 hypothetical protein SEA_WELCOME_24 [Microbacterium phage Welcome]UVK62441.1 hypothetical protein SEA_YUMA_23 [Microbacterium phage Yuma]
MGTINKPIEAWVREDDHLYIGFPEGKPPFAGIQATARAHEALEEFGYEIRPSYVEIREHKDVIYVHPDEYPLETWHDDSISDERRDEWIEVWDINIALIDHHRDCE